jgi:TPR repeat protein
MKRKYIKLNIDDNHLSLGNFCRILKNYSINKSAALQVDIFCTLFEVDDIQDTTVNNYCIGYRSIGDDYKQKYLELEKKYNNNEFVMVDIVLGILSILEGCVYSYTNYEEGINKINSSKHMKQFCYKLYNICKNDKQVKEEFSLRIYEYIENNNIYECIVKILFFIVLEKKQPIYEDDIKREVLENILKQTNISSYDLEKYLNLKFCEGSNYNYSLSMLAEKKNAYACFELGNEEYLGHIAGYPRYDISYSYLKVASDEGHPSACYLIGRMFINKNIGSGKKEELAYAYDMFNKAIKLGSISALNSLGVMYLEGIYPVDKDIDKAIKYFEKASLYNYVYSFNNLGKIYENNKQYDKAFSYYLKSANLKESWACNKVGECYRLGIGTNKDLRLAFEYYTKAMDVPIKYLCYYSKYNLALYYYLDGYMDIVPIPDRDKAISYLIDASSHGVFEALVLLFYISVNSYLKSRNSESLENIYKYKSEIEVNPKYNSKIREEIMDKLKEISNHKDIDISSII